MSDVSNVIGPGGLHAPPMLAFVSIVIGPGGLRTPPRVAIVIFKVTCPSTLNQVQVLVPTVPTVPGQSISGSNHQAFH